MKKIKFSQKLWIPFFISLIALVAISVFDAYKMRQIQIDGRKQLLVSVSTQAVNLVKQYDDLAKSGAMTEEEAKKQALERLRLIRYDGKGYFTISNSKNVIVMQPIKPEMAGKDLSNFKDPAGNLVFVMSTAASRETPQGGFFEYMWPQVGGTEPVPKLGFSIAYAPWDWVFSTGAYMDDINALFLRSLYSSLALMVLIGAVLAAVNYAINQSLLNALGGDPVYASEVVSRIAAGDLTGDIHVGRNDQRSLLYAMTRMRAALISVISSIQDGATTISHATSEIANGNFDLSSRTEHHASSIEETAASIEDLTQTVKKNADNARQANEISATAAEAAVNAGAVVNQVVQTMGAINESSRKIVDIIGVIDGIAFQTNILALNAAVEAARAGEQGRGFAVVASEVRGLAQRSASAAKEIKTLIGDSVGQVSAGSRLVEQAGGTMEQVVSTVKQVTEIVGDISMASRDQSNGIEEVSRAITDMNDVSQQNSALVEQASAASQSLQEQASKLLQAVSVFKIKHA